MAKSTKVLDKPPTALKPSDIHVASKVFQWRLPRRNIEPSDMHTLELVRVIQDGETALPPLLVYLIGERFYVLDGHHRLRAYRSVGWTRKIPVEVFTGTLEQARKVALQRNSRNKLPMTREGKSESCVGAYQEHARPVEVRGAKVDHCEPADHREHEGEVARAM